MIVLKVKLQDYSANRTLYKRECNLNNKQELLMMFSSLLAFGLDIRKIANELNKYETREALKDIQMREEEESWFH